MSVSVLLPRALLAAARAWGASPAQLSARANLDLEQLENDEGRVPHATHLALWRQVVSVCGADFGARFAAQQVRASLYGVLGYVMANSRDLAAAWAQFGRYSRLLYDELSVSEKRVGSEVELIYALPGAEQLSAVREAGLAAMVLLARQLAGNSFHCKAVQLKGGEVSTAFAHLVQCKIQHHAERDALVIDESMMRLPIRTADPLLGDLMGRFAADLAAKLPCSHELPDRVRHLLVQSMASGPLNLQQAAKRLGMTPRTLQRHLGSHRTTFAKLNDEVRHELAEMHMANSQLSIAEVAFLVGFNDETAFQKAFRRWAGQSPGASRRRLAGIRRG